MEFLFIALKNTLIQFGALFGVFLVGGFVLTWLARWTNNVFRQFRFPRFGLYVFGSLGVPVHELSHAVFCKLFFHEVKGIKWFDPKGRGGSHGAVTHYYSPDNLYHRLGHFFIGLGPVILGPLILAGLFRLLVPGAEAAFTLSPPDAAGGFRMFVQSLSAQANFSSVGFWVFAYTAAAIASSLELSREDMAQALTGIWILLFLLFTINIGAAAFRADWHGAALSAARGLLAFWAALFAFTAAISALNLAACTLVMGLLNRLFGRELINPFRTF